MVTSFPLAAYPRRLRRCLVVVLSLLSPTFQLAAHDGLDLPPPLSVPEAWNVITLCQANLEQLVKEQQWKEIPVQASLSMQAIQFLQQRAAADPSAEELSGRLTELHAAADFLVRYALLGQIPRAQRSATAYQQQLAEVARSYDEKVVRGPVFTCPMCRGIRSLAASTPCFKCGMKLVPRMIPASSIYNTPGEASIALTPTMSSPLAAGQKSEVRIRFHRKKDGAPVTPDDLLVVHTERIHLLIIDESLEDYHHEHPLPTDPPGEYAFSFTPRKPGAYRVFADVVPVLSNVQEYPMCDLPGSAPGNPIVKAGSTTTSAADGLHYKLGWQTGGATLRAQQPVKAEVEIADAEGKPFTQLEPIMGTYAHIVGFYEDRQTVIHIHPLGAEPQQATDRGGPEFSFRFYAPKAGYIRLYSQVQVGGVSRFAPFGLVVAP